MTLHHTKHHNTYVTNLNTLLEKLDTAVSQNDIPSMISLQPALRFNGGGHLNHMLFWKNLCASAPVSNIPSGPLLSSVEKKWGTFDTMKSVLQAKSVAVQGSGWGW